MTDLSPAAQAVLAAANGACCYGPDDVLNDSRWITAAALRAAADYDPPDNPDAAYDMGWYAGMEFIKCIADELESRS